MTVRAAARLSEEVALSTYCEKKVQEALDDPRHDVNEEEAWAAIEQLHAETLRRAKPTRPQYEPC